MWTTKTPDLSTIWWLISWTVSQPMGFENERLTQSLCKVNQCRGVSITNNFQVHKITLVLLTLFCGYKISKIHKSYLQLHGRIPPFQVPENLSVSTSGFPIQQSIITCWPGKPPLSTATWNVRNSRSSTAKSSCFLFPLLQWWNAVSACIYPRKCGFRLEESVKNWGEMVPYYLLKCVQGKYKAI